MITIRAVSNRHSKKMTGSGVKAPAWQAKPLPSRAVGATIEQIHTKQNHRQRRINLTRQKRSHYSPERGLPASFCEILTWVNISHYTLLQLHVINVVITNQ